jgi:ubiquitin C-terminal hydrolase
MISTDVRAIAQINSSIVNNSPLRGGAQEDVQEAFLFLINKVLGPAIMRLFQFRMKKTVSCTECRATIRSECIEDICFNIAPADIGVASLEEFLSQSIDVADGHFCAKCRRKTRKKICNSLLMVPEILCIYVPQLGARKQSINISKTIKFNSTANFLLKFKLIAAAQHHGNNDGGHYTAEVMRNGCIFHCDDSQITQIADFTRGANCSLLFYHYYE